MSSVNKVILVGNVGRDPERKTSAGGSTFFCFSLATSENWTDRASGERRNQTEWHRIVVFSTRCQNICESFIRKGTKLFIQGKIKTRSWTDNEGKERFTTEIIVDNFTGEIVMLGRNQMGGEDYDQNADDGDYQERQSSSRGNSSFGRPGGERGGSGQGSFGGFGDRNPSGNRTPSPASGWDSSGDPDLDDEIPF